LEIQDIQPINIDELALQNQVVAACYEIHLELGPNRDSLRSAVARLISKDSILMERRGKAYDLRPLIEALQVPTDAESDCHLRMQLSTRAGATGRPEQVLRALELDPHQAYVHRTALIFESEGS
jgi:hypothetical protein